MVESHAKRVAAGKKAARTRKRDIAAGRAKPYFSRSRARVRHSREKGLLSKIKWGEAALAALVGYEGGNILAPAGNIVATIGAKDSRAAQIEGVFYDVGSNWGANESGTTPQIVAKGMNKTMGMVAAAKVAYDVVKHHRLDSTNMNILLPYAIGTVFDPVKGSSSGGSW